MGYIIFLRVRMSLIAAFIDEVVCTTEESLERSQMAGKLRFWRNMCWNMKQLLVGEIGSTFRLNWNAMASGNKRNKSVSQDIPTPVRLFACLALHDHIPFSQTNVPHFCNQTWQREHLCKWAFKIIYINRIFFFNKCYIGEIFQSCDWLPEGRLGRPWIFQFFHVYDLLTITGWRF